MFTDTANIAFSLIKVAYGRAYDNWRGGVAARGNLIFRPALRGSAASRFRKIQSISGRNTDAAPINIPGLRFSRPREKNTSIM